MGGNVAVILPRRTSVSLVLPIVAALVGLGLSGFISCSGGGGKASAGNTPLSSSAPSIEHQPASQTVTLGQPATFAVVASGAPRPALQWFKNGAPVSGATLPTFTTPPTSKADDGALFTVAASNTAGSTNSEYVSLSVEWSPVIAAQPVSQSVTVGQAASFAVTVDANPAPGFQWQKNGQNLTGATNDSLTILTPALTDDGDIYTVIVSNGFGSQTSNPATLSVTPTPVQPSIDAQPLSASVQAGQSHSFHVVAVGTAPLTYQWRLNGVPISPSGASDTYTIAGAQAGDAGSYDVVIDNITHHPVTSDAAALTVTEVPVPPSITRQPSALMVTQGNSATFTVDAAGSAPLTYQWQKNLVDIPGANAATLSFVSAMADNGATYRCHVTNGVGGTDSSSAKLTVTESDSAPIINGFTALPATIAPGQSTTLAWAVTGAASIAIDNLVGTVTNLTSTKVTPAATGTYTYTLTATNTHGTTTATTHVTVTSQPAQTLTMTAGPGVTGTPLLTSDYPYGTAVPYMYSLQTGYKDLVVQVDHVTAPASGTLTMTVPHNITVSATQKTVFTVTFLAGKGGTLTGNTTQTITAGGSATAVTAHADSGYTFANWTGPGFTASTANPLTVTGVTADLTIIANFTPPPTSTYSVSFVALTGGKLTGDALQSVNSGGSTSAVTAAPDTGYDFVNWTIPGSAFTSTANPLTVTGVTSDLTVCANFKPKTTTYTVTFLATTGGTLTGSMMQTVSSGNDTTDVTAVPGAGYAFANWTGPGFTTSTANPLKITNVTATLTVYANFTQIPSNQGLHVTLAQPTVSGSQLTTSEFLVAVDGGPLTTPQVTRITGSAMKTGSVNIAVPVGSSYRVRAIALNPLNASNATSLVMNASGMATGLTVTAGALTSASITLAVPSVTFNAATSTTVTAGQTATVDWTYTDPGAALDRTELRGRVYWQSSAPGVDLSGQPSGAWTATAATKVDATHYHFVATFTAPPTAGTLYYQVGAQTFDLAVPGPARSGWFVDPSVLRGEAVRQITIPAVTTGIDVALTSPLATNEFLLVVDGGALAAPQVAHILGASIKTGSVKLGVPAGSSYRVRAIAIDPGNASNAASLVMNASGMKTGLTVTTGNLASAAITLAAPSVTFNTAPTTVTPGGQVTLDWTYTDPGASLDRSTPVGRVHWQASAFTSDLISQQLALATATKVDATHYRFNATFTAPATTGTLYYQVGGQTFDLLLPGLTRAGWFVDPSLLRGGTLRQITVQ
jgi:uncharacterized repeat protein (TIGR02543 family)